MKVFVMNKKACLAMLANFFLGMALFGISTNASNPMKTGKDGALAPPIAPYVAEVFEDSKGNLWIGTVGKGVARYDGKALKYFAREHGLGEVVTNFVEDQAGHLWLGMNTGLAKFDGKTFTIFTTANGLNHNRISAQHIDAEGVLWLGTWDGVCRFDGTTFEEFPLPTPNVALFDYQTTMHWITQIIEDGHGNLWFARDGYGVTKYDGKNFTTYTKKDGLASNNVQNILPDRQGHLWFASRVTERDHPQPEKRTGEGGLTRFDGKTMKTFPQIKGLSNNDIYALYEDRAGNLWIGANGVGLYRYDGQQFTLFKETNKSNLKYNFGIQSIQQDRNGTLWLGISGGLFHLQATTITHVSQNGPWP